MQNSDFRTRLTSLYGSQSSSAALSTHNSLLSPRIKRPYGFQPSPVVLCIQNSDFRTRITSLCWSIDHTCGFCRQNSDFWSGITSLYGSQNSPVIFYIQNSVPSIRITSLYGSQPLSVVFAFKQAPFGAELQVSMGPRHDLSFCECKTAGLASELLVSMVANPHVWFLHANQLL